MTYLILGFVTGSSLIIALGPQNIFVIEQGLKKEFIFLVCLICSVSDFLLIFLGIFVLLLIFLLNCIRNKMKIKIKRVSFVANKNKNSLSSVIFKTLGFTYLNPHVYSDTVFFLGNFSKDLILSQKLFFWIGASFSSYLAFFTLGYFSKYLSSYLKTTKIWKIINLFIIIFMSFLCIYVLTNITNFLRFYL